MAEPEENLEPVKNVESCIEAVVFAAGHPVTYAKLSEVTGLGVREIKRLVERIAKSYEGDKHGIMLLQFKDSCQFCTKEQYGPYIREALGIRRGGNLSGSSMEVLAVVAYHQPVTRAFVDEVRGVDSAYAVNSLIDKELIAAVGRLDAPGRPVLYGTTEKFLRVFGMQSLGDLPKTSIELPTNEQGEQLTMQMAEKAAAGEAGENADTSENAEAAGNDEAATSTDTGDNADTASGEAAASTDAGESADTAGENEAADMSESADATDTDEAAGETAGGDLPPERGVETPDTDDASDANEAETDKPDTDVTDGTSATDEGSEADGAPGMGEASPTDEPPAASDGGETPQSP